jgi:pantoate--beta-alanine ligase
MIAVNDIPDLRRILDEVRESRGRIGFVPTMGFLHEGHLALCDEARRHADFVVMSVFVNPLQFGANEDLDRYPRDLARDAQLAMGRGVSLLFAPPGEQMYPHGDSAIRVTAPGLAERLCGRYRPGHFEGVLTVVAKLFNLVQPHVAVFGQKDLQQAVLIRRMARDLDVPVEIVVAPIVREPDGLAMSSRNVYLSPAERASALALHRALKAAQTAFSGGETDPARLVHAARAILEAESGVSIQYVEVVDPESLEPPLEARRGDAVAIAAHVGATRLIDNHLLD